MKEYDGWACFEEIFYEKPGGADSVSPSEGVGLVDLGEAKYRMDSGVWFRNTKNKAPNDFTMAQKYLTLTIRRSRVSTSFWFSQFEPCFGVDFGSLL